MRKITKIEYQKNNKDRVNIYLDEKFAFGLDLNIMIKYSLSKNLELEENFIEDILMAEEESKVYNYALSVLSRYAKSEKQLRNKLVEKGYDNKFIDNAIIKLKHQRFLDDVRFSEMVISQKISVSKYGKQRIKQALYEKGIDKQIIEEKLMEISHEDELERALSLGTKKIRTLKEKDNRKLIIKLSNFLINKGFDFSTVKKAVSMLINDRNETDIFFED